MLHIVIVHNIERVMTGLSLTHLFTQFLSFGTITRHGLRNVVTIHLPNLVLT